VGWDPSAGNLLLYGVGGAGTTSALVALALGRARLQPPDRLHVYALDMGAGDLSPLAGLAHTGAYVGPTEPERQKRLVRLLRRELDSRRSSTGSFPEWLVLLDNLGAFLAEHDRDASGMRLIEDLARVFADGRGVGIHFAVTAERIGGVPTSWAALTQQKLLFRLADLTDYGFFDVPRTDVPAFVPGRAVIAPTHQVVQVVWNGSDLAPAVGAVNARWEGVARTAHPVGSLPGRVELGELGATAQTSRAPWWIPAGLGDRFLETVGLTLYEHEHALIAGPARSGRSSALCTLASAVLAADRPPAVLGVAVRRSPLRSLAGLTRMVTNLDDLPDALADLQARPLLVLVDDADTIEQCEPIESLLRTGSEHVHLIAAGRNDVLRRSYGHWTQKVRESRCGLLLMPDHDMDGELLSVALPRMDRIAPVPGRGYIASDGTLDGVQVAGLWEEGVDARAC
ncbi:MAG: hypothetical protein J2P45_28935, partial [Candidatus Dormibacteraeota bacterium]|nr:hypothetical protein [Candidatus Dormibacteraeota bacterium]